MDKYFPRDIRKFIDEKALLMDDVCYDGNAFNTPEFKEYLAKHGNIYNHVGDYVSFSFEGKFYVSPYFADFIATINLNDYAEDPFLEVPFAFDTLSFPYSMCGDSEKAFWFFCKTDDIAAEVINYYRSVQENEKFKRWHSLVYNTNRERGQTYYKTPFDKLIITIEGIQNNYDAYNKRAKAYLKSCDDYLSRCAKDIASDKCGGSGKHH